MDLKIRFKVLGLDGESEKKISRTFSNINQEATNENMIEFAKAYMGLTDINEYEVVKITTEDVK